VKILIVDDHALIRDAVRAVLKELDPGVTVVEASDSRAAMRQLEQNPDIQLVLLDLGLPDRDGFEVLASLRDLYPAVSVVVLSAHRNPDIISRSLDLGALGFIPKSAERGVMLGALNLVFAGGVYVPPEIRASEKPVSGRATRPAETQGRRPETDDPLLTARQAEVLALMMKGKANKAICRELGLAEPTVKNHVTAILKALNVSNRTEAVIAAGALRLETPRGADG
jgi:DNA-binding NarL/FixJ family response regulator